MDAFAAGALTFERHYAAATSSLSLYSWYTGLPRVPHAHSRPGHRHPPRGSGPHPGRGAAPARLAHAQHGGGALRPSGAARGPTDPTRRARPLAVRGPGLSPSTPGRADYPRFGFSGAAVPYALEWFRRTPAPRFLHLWFTDPRVYHRHPAFRPAAGLAEPEPVYAHENPCGAPLL
jgi:hypothetical protein